MMFTCSLLSQQSCQLGSTGISPLDVRAPPARGWAWAQPCCPGPPSPRGRLAKHVLREPYPRLPIRATQAPRTIYRHFTLIVFSVLSSFFFILTSLSLQVLCWSTLITFLEKGLSPKSMKLPTEM